MVTSYFQVGMNTKFMSHHLPYSTYLEGATCFHKEKKKLIYSIGGIHFRNLKSSSLSNYLFRLKLKDNGTIDDITILTKSESKKQTYSYGRFGASGILYKNNIIPWH